MPRHAVPAELSWVNLQHASLSFLTPSAPVCATIGKSIFLCLKLPTLQGHGRDHCGGSREPKEQELGPCPEANTWSGRSAGTKRCSLVSKPWTGIWNSSTQPNEVSVACVCVSFHSPEWQSCSCPSQTSISPGRPTAAGLRQNRDGSQDLGAPDLPDPMGNKPEF